MSRKLFRLLNKWGMTGDSVMNRSECVSILQKQGLNLIPLKKGEKTPIMTWASYQHKKYDGELSGEANIGAICGQTSGNLVVIDLDISDISILDQILPDVLDHTLVTKTGKGYHIYIKVPKLPNTLRMDGILGRIDVQSDGTYVVAPTSVHPNGSIYQIKIGRAHV